MSGLAHQAGGGSSRRLARGFRTVLRPQATTVPGGDRRARRLLWSRPCLRRSSGSDVARGPRLAGRSRRSAPPPGSDTRHPVSRAAGSIAGALRVDPSRRESSRQRHLRLPEKPEGCGRSNALTPAYQRPSKESPRLACQALRSGWPPDPSTAAAPRRRERGRRAGRLPRYACGVAGGPVGTIVPAAQNRPLNC